MSDIRYQNRLQKEKSRQILQRIGEKQLENRIEETETKKSGSIQERNGNRNMPKETEWNKRRIGEQKEKLACAFLARSGVTILEQNFRCRQGEIDIVARDGEYLVFAEVKYRSTRNKGTALEAVGIAKQKKICRTADYYRMTHGCGSGSSVRYDVIGIQEDEVLWVRNAFPHRY